MVFTKNTFLLLMLAIPAIAFGQTIYYNPNLSELDNFRTGFEDTFHENSNVFRVVVDSTNAPEYRFQLEKLAGGQWVKRFSFGYGIGFHDPDYNRRIDFNCDGYNDLVVYSSFGGGAYIYDTATAEFSNPPLKRPYDWKVLNAPHKLLCSLDFDLNNGDGVSLMYTFQGVKVIPLYYLQIKNKENSYEKTCILYKCQDGDICNKTKIAQQAVYSQTYNFYEGFWKTRYKKLMGYE